MKAAIAILPLAAIGLAALAMGPAHVDAQPPGASEGFVEAHDHFVPTQPGSPLEFSREELRNAIQAEFSRPVPTRNEPAQAAGASGTFSAPPAAFQGQYQSVAGFQPPPPRPERRRPAPVAQDREPSSKLLLRDMAHRLDGMAHELEIRELFRQADGLREVAARLRTDARADVPGGKSTLQPPTRMLFPSQSKIWADPGPGEAPQSTRQGMPDRYRPYINQDADRRGGRGRRASPSERRTYERNREFSRPTEPAPKDEPPKVDNRSSESPFQALEAPKQDRPDDAG